MRSLTLFCAALLSAVTTHAPAGVVRDATSVTLTHDGIEVRIDGPEQFDLRVDGMHFGDQAYFAIREPKTNRLRFHLGGVDKVFEKADVADLPGGGCRAVLKMRSPEMDALATKTVSLLPGRRLVVDVELWVAPTDEVVAVEHRLGGFFPHWFAGRPYSATLADGSSRYGTLPMVPPKGNSKQLEIAGPLKRLRVETPAGPLELHAAGDHLPTLRDFREYIWSKGRPNFWLGLETETLKAGTTTSYTVELRFPPSTDGGSAGVATAAGGAIPTRTAMPLVRPADRVFPTPKHAEWREKDLSLKNNAVFAVRSAGADDDLASSAGLLAEEFAEFLRAEHGVTLKRAAGRVADRGAAIVFRAVPRGTEGAHSVDGGYVVDVGATLSVDAATTGGFVNAVKTLRQLVRTDGRRVSLRGCRIEDWPAMPFRGIHFYTGKDARELQVRMVRNILGALKINAFVYQVDLVRWESEPRIHNFHRGMAKADAVAVVEEARRQHIEVIPLVNTFGHAEWLLGHKATAHLQEKPGDPYVYDPSNPEVYEICTRIYDECIAMFRPRIFHIGHDEITLSGFPHREQNKAVGATQLILDDIEFYRQYLAKRGIRTMIWGDMFVDNKEMGAPMDMVSTGSEEAIRRGKLHRDVMVADWHYDAKPPEFFTSPEIFNRAGFDVVACPWNDPENIIHFTRAVAGRTSAPHEDGVGRTLGMLQTTWAGFSFDEDSYPKNLDQYQAYFLAAEAAWTGAPTNYDELSFDHRTEYARLWDPKRPQVRAGWLVDLAPAANLDLVDAERDGWLGGDGTRRLGGIPTGTVTLGDATFMVPGGKVRPRAVLLAGRMNGAGEWPTTVTLRVGAKASSLRFVTAATHTTVTDPVIAHTVVEYTDGSCETFAWRMGANVYAVDDYRSNPAAPLLWYDRGPGVRARALHGFAWENPRPGSEIRAIHMVSADDAAGLMLLGVTGVE